MEGKLRVTMPDTSVWEVPCHVIAENRAAYFQDDYGDDLMTSLLEDTAPLFESCTYEIMDWARNNMDWDDVKDVATMVSPPAPRDTNYQEGWVNGCIEVR